MVLNLSSGSSKGSRAMRSGNSMASCLVDGCVSDLSRCREYHRRHKVCEVHSKAATLMVGGRVQRFCQQCSRFHLLVEFDDMKRSCRKRLEGHNRRRRKPQLRSLNFGSYVTDQQGAEFTSYPQAFSTSTPKSNWAPIVKVDEYANKEQFPVLSHGIIYKDDKKFPLVQEKVFTYDSVRSLLSSPKAQNLACNGYGNSNLQPLISSMKYDGILNCQTWRENLVDFNCYGLFHAEGEGSSDGDLWGLPISWQ